MLTYIEQLATDLENTVAETNQQKKRNSANEDNNEDDLAQITGGNDAEIDQFKNVLYNITEEKLV